MNFDPLFLSPQWLQEFHTKYPHGLSVLENIIEWLNQTNRLIDYVNVTPEKVESILREWQGTGELDQIINDALKTVTDEYERNTLVLNNILKPGDDFSTVLNAALATEGVDRVRVNKGVYYLKSPIIIPRGKELILEGRKSAYLTDYERLNHNLASFFCVLEPHITQFVGDYLVYMSDKSTIRGGFLNCYHMKSGGGIKIDFSQTQMSRIWIDKTIIHGNSANASTRDTTGIFLNADRPVGTVRGFLYMSVFDVGISGFRKGIHFKRHDTYTQDVSTVNGISWMTSLKILGYMYGCNRYVWFDNTVSSWGGSTTDIKLTIQSTPVLDKELPAIEFNTEDVTLECVFHDFSTTNPLANQKYIYKFNTGASGIVYREKRFEPKILDYGNMHYALDHGQNQVLSITPLNGWTGTVYLSKDDSGLCWLRGQLTVGTKTFDTSVIEIPAGYRSPYRFDVPSILGSGTVRNGLVYNAGAYAVKVYPPGVTDFTPGETVHINVLYMINRS